MTVFRTKVYLRALRLWRYRLLQRVARLGLPEYTVFSIFSVITGAVAGIAAVLFHASIGLFSEIFFHQGAAVFGFLGPYFVIILPALGMLIQSVMILLAPVTARNRGVLDVIKSVAMRGGHIPFRTTLFHFLAPAICIGSGGTVGPEGPVAQLGGGAASKVGGLFGLSDVKRRMFTAAGSGAAIAAVFNTPLAGIFFTLEVVLLNDFRAPIFSVLILATVTSSAISRIFLGNVPTFAFSDLSIGPYNQLYLYALLGVGAGLIALFYIYYSESLSGFCRKRILSKAPQWLVMTIVGLLVGVAGYFYSEIFGIGYAAINEILAGQLTWKTVAALLVLKFILVPLILSSGGFGGIFAPSLVMGASFGFLFATALNGWLGLHLDVTSYTLVSMGAVLGGINSIPISAIMMIFEMTRDYSFILPLMLSVVVSTTITQLIIKRSIYRKHLEQQGYHFTGGREENILRSIKVRDVLNDDVVLIPKHLPLPQLIGQVIESPHSTFYTVDKDGHLVGIIAESELRPIITDYEHLRGVLVAEDIAKPGGTVVRADDNLDFVLKLFGHENVDEFPVVSAENPDRIIGSIARQDVIAAYNRESLKHNLAEGLAHDLQAADTAGNVQVSKDYSIVSRPVPPRFVGKTPGQLRLRNKYGLELLMVKHSSGVFSDEASEARITFPHVDYVFQEGDQLVLFGKNESLAAAEKW